MPLKRAGLDLAASVMPRAQQVGAANTLLPTPQGWQADNTDVAGVLGALEGVAPGQVTLVGAGGTAQAVVVALGELGVGECTVLVRDVARGEELLGTARRAGLGLTLAHLDMSSPALAADLVVSTVPAGAADALAGAAWHAGQTLLDVVYAPWPTSLAAAVSAAGGQVRSGALMLLHQAMVQVELMTGLPAPAAAMRSALAAVAPNSGL
jgi:shikimate dehydrogenase